MGNSQHAGKLRLEPAAMASTSVYVMNSVSPTMLPSLKSSAPLGACPANCSQWPTTPMKAIPSVVHQGLREGASGSSSELWGDHIVGLVMPTPRNAPLLVVLAVVAFICIYTNFLREKESSAKKAVRKERLRQILSAMSTALAWEIELDDLKPEDSPTEALLRLLLPLDDGCEEDKDKKDDDEEEKCEEQLEEERQSKMPAAQHVYRLLFDEDE